LKDPVYTISENINEVHALVTGTYKHSMGLAYIS
jgi:hypothetical protein